jgi:hypothetical protein
MLLLYLLLLRLLLLHLPLDFLLLSKLELLNLTHGHGGGRCWRPRGRLLC